MREAEAVRELELGAVVAHGGGVVAQRVVRRAQRVARLRLHYLIVQLPVGANCLLNSLGELK